MTNISNLRKRRGTTKASITRLSTKLKRLESVVHEPSTLELAQQLISNFKTLDARFKEQHFSIVDLIDEKDEATLSRMS